MKADSYPSYLTLAESGELEPRARQAVASLADCRACPRHCGVNRLENRRGLCRIGRHAVVSSYFPHQGEENCLRGWRGSGTIFFSGCNLGCVFCQNWEISQKCEGRPAPPRRLAEMMLELQESGCHNINWVTPEHVVPQALEALSLAAAGGLRLPIVYNTSAYDSIESLRLLDGVVDIYMPDFKAWSEDHAARLLGARDYPEVARRAIREMHRQVGVLATDKHGIVQRGVLVRHLVLPNDLSGTDRIAHWLATELSPDTYVNIMDQYRPAWKAAMAGSRERYADVSRGLTAGEWNRALQAARAGGLRRFDLR